MTVQRRKAPHRDIRARTAVVALGITLASAGCTGTPAPAPGTAAPEGAAGAEHVVADTAERVLQVSSVHEETGMTLLEGPTFGPDGRLYLVDVTAPAGSPKVLAVDLATLEIDPVYTDDAGAYTSAQWSPTDGRLYLTDYMGGRIVSITADGKDPRTFAAGPVDGRPTHLDDLTFDDDGHLFATDSAPTVYPSGDQRGRILRFDRDSASPTVLADGLANPNGLAFDLSAGSLWVSLLDANRIDHLTLSEDRTAVTAGHTAMYVDGGTTQTDSIAVDAEGNVYQSVHGEPRILVFAPDGSRRGTITVPDDHEGLESATNVAIRPGTTDAYMTVSGPAGGYVYRFEALAEGTRQSNGG